VIATGKFPTDYRHLAGLRQVEPERAAAEAVSCIASIMWWYMNSGWPSTCFSRDFALGTNACVECSVTTTPVLS